MRFVSVLAVTTSLTLGLTLAACDSTERANDASEGAEVTDTAVPIADNGVPAETETTMNPASPADTVTDDTSDSQEATDRALAQPMGKAFPRPFQGRWGSEGDCTDTQGGAKGLMVINGDTVRFYEARGVVKTMTIETPTRVTAELAFEGEGQTWTKSATFTLTDGGRTIRRTETNPTLDYRYPRCPG